MTFVFEISRYFYTSRKVQQNLANNLILFPHTSLSKILPVHLSLTVPVIMWRRHHNRTFLLQFNCLWIWLILFPYNFALGLRMQRLCRGRSALCDTPCVCINWHFVNLCCPLFQSNQVISATLVSDTKPTDHRTFWYWFQQTFPFILYVCQGVFLMSQEKWLTYCFWRSAHIMTQQTFKQPTGADCTTPLARCHQT